MRKINRSFVISCGVAGAIGGSLMLSNSAQAAYTGLSAELHTTVTIDGVARSVYRVYANFTDSGDRLYSVYGSPTIGAMTIQSYDQFGGAGSAFYDVAGNNKAPTQSQINAIPSIQWDTFVTIGVSVADQAPFGDETTFTPGFVGITGNSYSNSNGGWYLTPTIDHDNNPGTPEIVSPQSEAGFAGDGDLANRVMLLQLTVNAGDHVAGTVNLVAFNNTALAGGTIGSQIIAQQSFNTIPGAGALALLGVAGAFGSRRRRTA